MVKKITKYLKFVVCMALIVGLIAPSYAALSASDGSAFVTKAEFDSALADFNARLTTFEAGINSKIDSQVSSYLDRNGIWNGKNQEWGIHAKNTFGFFAYDMLKDIPDNTETTYTLTYNFTGGQYLRDYELKEFGVGNVIGTAHDLREYIGTRSAGRIKGFLNSGESIQTRNWVFVDQITKSGLLFMDITANVWSCHNGAKENGLNLDSEIDEPDLFSSTAKDRGGNNQRLPFDVYINKNKNKDSKQIDFIDCAGTNYGAYNGGVVTWISSATQHYPDRFATLELSCEFLVNGVVKESLKLFDWAPVFAGPAFTGFDTSANYLTGEYQGWLMAAQTEPTTAVKSIFVRKNDNAGLRFVLTFGGRQPQNYAFTGSSKPCLVPAIEISNPCVY